MFNCGNAQQAYTLISEGVDFNTDHISSSGSFCLCPNSVDEDSPFYDLRVRQAVACAIDREAICEAVGFGILKPAYQMTPEGYAGHLEEDNEFLIEYDPEKAKQLLEEAGYGDGLTTKLYSNVLYQDTIVAIQSELEKVGIHCELEFPESGALSDLYYNGWDGIIALNFGQIINTGVSYYIWYHPSGDSYVSAMRPDEYEAMYYEARRSFEIDNELFGALGQLVLEYMTFVPIYHTYTISFVRNGLEDTGFGIYSVDTIWKPWDAWWSI
jgi:peptide/nickel transport system substrate-binding protein